MKLDKKWTIIGNISKILAPLEFDADSGGVSIF